MTTDEIIIAARTRYADPSDNEIEIDDSASTSNCDGGTWVQAWVWVADEE